MNLLPAKMEAEVDTLCLLAQPNDQKKGKNAFNNKKQPELPESRTVWKSNNQGDKEETLIQTGRRGRDVWRAGRTRERLRLAEPAVPHLHTNKLGGTTGE